MNTNTRIVMGGLGSKYGVWCTVSGGVTGSREAWLKDNGERVECDTRAEAQAIAKHYTDQAARRPGYSAAVFTYTARPIGGQS